MIQFSTADLLLILYVFGWPWVAGFLLLALFGLWRFWRRRTRWILASLAILGSVPVAAIWFSEWQKETALEDDRQYWQAVSAAAGTGDYTQAQRLLADRKDGFSAYVERVIDDDAPVEDTTLLRAAFARCVDLLDYRSLSISVRLDEVVRAGHPEIVKAWLDTPACPGGGNREEGLREMALLLAPDTGDGMDPSGGRLRERQAQALKLLVERYPALLDAKLSDRCDKACPTLLSALLEKRHPEGIETILPLDTHAADHLPPVALHILRGDTRGAGRAARADPKTFHRYLPDLLATAPLPPLRAALGVAAPDEATLLTPAPDETLYQHLWPLFSAVKRRDQGQPGWDFLSLLFDLFPHRLKEVDTSLYSGYVIGVKAGDSRLHALLIRLRRAGMDCEAFGRLAAWGDDTEEGKRWIAQETGCPNLAGAPSSPSP